MTSETNTVHNNRPFWKKALLALVLDLICFVVMAGVLEISIRHFIPSVRQLIFNKNITGGHTVIYNSWGLRNKEISADFPADGIRVILTGNSATFGSGVAMEETFASQLDALLRQRRDGIKYDIINAGIQGQEDMERYFNFQKKYCAEFHPKAVVLILTPHHVAPRKLSATASKVGKANILNVYLVSPKRIPFNIHVFLFKHFYTYIVFDRLIRQSLFLAGLMRENLTKLDNNYLYGFAMDVPAVKPEKAEAAYDELARNILELKKLLDSQGIKFMIIAIPTRFQLSNLRKDNLRNVPLNKIRTIPGQRFKEIAEQDGIPFVDMLPVLREKRQEMLEGKTKYDPLYIPFDNIHLNPTGHRLVAEQLGQMLIANGIIPPDKQPE